MHRPGRPARRPNRPAVSRAPVGKAVLPKRKQGLAKRREKRVLERKPRLTPKDLLHGIRRCESVAEALERAVQEGKKPNNGKEMARLFSEALQLNRNLVAGHHAEKGSVEDNISDRLDRIIRVLHPEIVSSVSVAIGQVNSLVSGIRRDIGASQVALERMRARKP